MEPEKQFMVKIYYYDSNVVFLEQLKEVDMKHGHVVTSTKNVMVTQEEWERLRERMEEES